MDWAVQNWEALSHRLLREDLSHQVVKLLCDYVEAKSEEQASEVTHSTARKIVARSITKAQFVLASIADAEFSAIPEARQWFVYGLAHSLAVELNKHPGNGTLSLAKTRTFKIEELLQSTTSEKLKTTLADLLEIVRSHQ